MAGQRCIVPRLELYHKTQTQDEKRKKKKMFLVGSQAVVNVFVECTLACVCV